ncbi:baseplate J/gp47 family protein, partial [Desulfovibrio oxamicus]
NAASGISLTLTSPVSGVQATGTVAAGGIIGGLDAEDDDSLRARVLRRIQEPPQGGKAADYVTWALEVPGVTRAFVYPLHMGGGTVGVAVVNDDAVDGPIPEAELVADVQAYLDTMRPVTAEVFAFAPTPLVVNVDLRVTPNTEAVRAAATAELRDLFARESEPGATIYLSHITEAISLAPGEQDHVVLAPAADVVPAAHEMPVLGTITYE